MKKKDIGKLYEEQFQSFEAPVGPQEWLAVQSGIGKAQFLTFNVAHFNVYYLAAAVTVGGGGVTAGVYKYYNSNSGKPNDPIKKEIMVQPSATEKKSDTTVHFNEALDRLEKTEKNKEENNKDSKIKPADVLAVDTTNLKKENIPVQTEEIKNSKPDTSASLPKPRPKRVVYVNKQDTIVVRDTVTEPPKKKRKK